MERTKVRDILAYVVILIGSFALLTDGYNQVIAQTQHNQNTVEGDWFGFNAAHGTTRTEYGSYAAYEYLFGVEEEPYNELWDIVHYIIMSIGETMHHASWIDYQPVTTFRTREELNEHLQSSWINTIPRFFSTKAESVQEIPDPGFFVYVMNSVCGVLDMSRWTAANWFMVTLTAMLSVFYCCMRITSTQKSKISKKDIEIKSNQMVAENYVRMSKKKYLAIKKNYRVTIDDLKDQLKVKDAELEKYTGFVEYAGKNLAEQREMLQAAANTCQKTLRVRQARKARRVAQGVGAQGVGAKGEGPQRAQV